MSDVTTAAAAAAAVSPPRRLPGGREESARVRDHENTNGRPHLASNHLLSRRPELPQCFAVHGHVTVGSAPSRPNKPCPAAREPRGTVVW